jgi:hypothetical protein
MVQDGTHAGLALPKADREWFTAWEKELSQACLEFSVSNISMHQLVDVNLIDRLQKISTRRM